MSLKKITFKDYLINEATYAGKRSNVKLPSKPYVVDKDEFEDYDIIDSRVENFFSYKEEEIPDEAFDYDRDQLMLGGAPADIFAYIEDSMGANTVYHWKGMFFLYDRHTGWVSWAKPGVTSEEVLDNIGYYLDPDDLDDDYDPDDDSDDYDPDDY